MELTKQVPNLQLCKKLKELGWDKETLFYYVLNLAIKGKDPKHESIVFYKNTRSYQLFKKVESGGCVLYIPAPTVAELGEVMPCKVKISGMDMYLETVKHEDYFECYYKFLNVACSVFFQEATEADARAKMWIYLKENKLI